MGLIGLIRASSVNIGGEIHKCPEIWISPEFVDRVRDPWSWRFDHPSPLEDETPWRIGPDVFLGQHVVYERGCDKAVWRVDRVDHQAGLLLGRWPD